MLGVITEILYCTSHSKKYYIVLNIAVLFILIKKKKKIGYRCLFITQKNECK